MVWYEDWTGIVKKQPVSGGEKKKKQTLKELLEILENYYSRLL